MAREGVGNPRVLVGEIPDGDTNTFVNSQAGVGDGGVIGSLLLQSRVGVRQGAEADIELGVGKLADTKINIRLQDVGQITLAGRAANDEVGL